MSALPRGLAVLLVLCVPGLADANGHWRRPVTTASYYYYWPAPPVPAAVPVYSVPVAVAVPVAPVPAAPTYAPPAPACPSQAPLDLPMPPAGPVPAVKETESRASSGQTVTAARVASTVTVSFWNRSAQDVTLRVAGEKRILTRGRGLTLDLPREFVWQVNDRAEENERVPVEKSGVEITIQR